MKVRELRRRLEALLPTQDAGSAEPELREFLLILAERDDMNVADLFRRLRGKAPLLPGTGEKPPPPDPRNIVLDLQQKFSDDQAFAEAMRGLAKQRSVTRALLVQVFYSLFDRKRGVPAKATRPEVLRLIESERNILVRNQKMGEMLGRRVVPAE